MNKLKRRIPNYCYHTPEDLTEHYFESVDDFEKVDWIEKWKSGKGFESFYVDRDYIGKFTNKDKLRLIVRAKNPKMWDYYIGILEQDIPELPTYKSL